MADDAAGAVRHTPRDELIEQAARVLYDGVHDYDRLSDQLKDIYRRRASALAGMGYLAGPAQRDELEKRRTELAAVEDALHGLDSDLGDDAPLGARVQELHESYLDMTRCHSEEVERTQRLTIERDRALADAREWKRIAEERNGTARVMADLRDQVTAAQSEKETARSDAEEFRSERDYLAGQLEDAVASERDRLLPRLAKLAEAAGKLRTAEWLRTCATLPIEEWPPAPEYKGPVVHLDDPRPDFAAMTKPQLRDLRLRIVNELRQRRGLPDHWPAEAPSAIAERDLAVWLHAETKWWLDQYKHDATVWKRQVDRTEAERDEAVALCANLQSTLLNRLAELTEVGGKARSTEWLRTCATLPPDQWPPAPAYKGPMVPVADLDLALWLHAEAQHRAEKLTYFAGPFLPARQAAIEALRGDQPTESKAASEPRRIADSRCRHGKRPLWCAICAGVEPEQPTGEADRG